jgi:hypothetical protein
MGVWKITENKHKSGLKNSKRCRSTAPSSALSALAKGQEHRAKSQLRPRERLPHPYTDADGNKTGTKHPALLDPALVKSHECAGFPLLGSPARPAIACAAALLALLMPEAAASASASLVRLRGAVGVAALAGWCGRWKGFGSGVRTPSDIDLLILNTKKLLLSTFSC